MASQQQQVQAIDITKLSIQQLDSLKTQLTQEINVLQDSLGQLKMVQQSFSASDSSVDSLKVMCKSNDEILVPLTSSLYVPGKLKSNDRVLIDIGTGYYVNKTADDAKKHFKKKVDFVTKQMETLQPILQQKHLAKEEIIDVLQMKIQAATAAQQQQQQQAQKA